MKATPMRTRAAIALLVFATVMVAAAVIAYTTVASEVFALLDCGWNEKIQDGEGGQKARIVGTNRVTGTTEAWITDTGGKIKYDETTSCNSPTSSSWVDGLFNFSAYAASASTYACEGRSLHQVYDGQYYHNSGNIIYSGR